MGIGGAPGTPGAWIVGDGVCLGIFPPAFVEVGYELGGGCGEDGVSGLLTLEDTGGGGGGLLFSGFSNLILELRAGRVELKWWWVWW